VSITKHHILYLIVLCLRVVLPLCSRVNLKFQPAYFICVVCSVPSVWFRQVKNPSDCCRDRGPYRRKSGRRRPTTSPPCGRSLHFGANPVAARREQQRGRDGGGSCKCYVGRTGGVSAVHHRGIRYVLYIGNHACSIAVHSLFQRQFVRRLMRLCIKNE